MIKKLLSLTLCLALLLMAAAIAFPNTALAAATTSIHVIKYASDYSNIGLSVSPANQTQEPGSSFDIEVVINTNAVSSRGAQVSLTFDPSLLQCNSVEEGDFFKSWAQAYSCSTIVFPAPQIDNNTGHVSDIGIAIMGQTAGGPSGSGTFCIYHMTAKAGASGQSSVILTDAQIADQTGVILQGITLNNGQVTVGSTAATTTTAPAVTTTTAPAVTSTPVPTSTSTATPVTTITSTLIPTQVIPPVYSSDADVNNDGVCNILDVVDIGLHWGETGSPGWDTVDVNKDGTVNILDVVRVGLSWGGTRPAITLTPTPTPYSNVGLSISPVNQTESSGSTFDIKVMINTGNVISRGAQVSLIFDPSLLQCNSVDEGDFFKSWAQSHSCSTIVFPTPEINNNSGQVSDIGIAIMGQTTGGPSGSGTFCTYHMTTKAEASGQSSIILTDAQIADQTGVILRGITVNNGQVTVGNTTPISISGGVTTPTPAPMPLVTPPPASSAPAVNWSLIGGIIGAVIVIGAGTYLLFTRRRNTSAS